MKSIRPQSDSVRPSKSERPGLPRFLGTLIMDPWWFVFQLVMAIAEGITRAIVHRKKTKTTKTHHRTED